MGVRPVLAGSFDEAAVIALGSNRAGHYSSRQTLLEAAVVAVAALGAHKRSSWWRSTAWPDPGQPDFLNGVMVVETALSPEALLRVLQDIEIAFGRRPGPPNAARTLDLDLIAQGQAVIDRPGLILPHPRAHERRFVMGPLAEIVPDWRHPVLGQSAVVLARLAKIGLDAEPWAS